MSDYTPTGNPEDDTRLVSSLMRAELALIQTAINSKEDRHLLVLGGTEAQGATVNDFVITVTPALSAYTSGSLVSAIATHANTGAATLKISALTAKTLKDVDGSPLASGDITSGAVLTAYYDGTDFFLVSGNDRVARAGDIYTGTHDFTGATITAATASAGTNTTQVANTAHVFAERSNAATLTNKTLTTPVVNSPTGIAKGDVGLSNVDNTNDASKPISTATQTALNLKATLASNTFTGAQNMARATVASHATTADIWSASGNQINWTGTATTTTFPAAPQAGAERVLICAAACSFTASANMLIDGVALATTVTCAVNDTVIVRAVTTTQFKLSRIKFDGTAQVSAGAALWVPGTTYSVGDLVWGPANWLNFRRKIAGAGTIDPSSDVTNWAPATLEINTGRPTMQPSLLLDFANSKQIDKRVTFTRASSATYTDYDGIVKLANINTPRFEHNPITGQCLGHLIENTSTNLLLYSEQFNNAAWVSTATITADNAISPDGTTTADLINDLSNIDAQSTIQSVTITNDSAAYTFSVFVKKNTSRYCALWMSFQGTITRERVWEFDLDDITSQADGGSPATSGSIIDMGNGWRKLTITASNTTEGNTTLHCRILPAVPALGGVSGTTIGSVWAWGAQLELGVSASSYIPTTTVAVTRSADNSTISGANFNKWYRQVEGTVVIDSINQTTQVLTLNFSIDDGSNNNFISHRFGSLLGGIPATDNVHILVGAVPQVDTSGFIREINTKYISVVAYKINDVAFTTNGGAIITDTLATIPIVNQLSMSSGNKILSRLVYYPKRLTNAELLAVSTV